MKDSNVEDIYELSPLQAGMLFHCIYEPESALYFEQVTMGFEANIHAPSFGKAWQALAARHPIFRTSFHWEGLEKSLQVVHRKIEVEIQTIDLQRVRPPEKKERFQSFLIEDRRRGLNLSKAPLFRVALVRFGPRTYQVVLTFHHILLDGWSLPLVFEDFSKAYKALAQAKTPRWESRRPFADYIAWLQQQDLGSAEQYWRRALNGYPGPVQLRVEKHSGPLGPNGGGPEDFGDSFRALSREQTALLQEFARKQQITLNTLVQGAWGLLLSRYCGEADVVFGAIVSGRPPSLAGVESMIGMFINTIPIRVSITPEDRSTSWLKVLQARQFEARQYEYSPLVQVQGWSEVARGKPLFETILVFENYPMNRGGRPGLSRPGGEVRAFERTNYPLCLIAGPAPELHFRLLYDRRRFAENTVDAMLAHFEVLLLGLASDAHLRVRSMPLVVGAERERLLERWNAPLSPMQEEDCIHTLFTEQARRAPKARALICGAVFWSYEKLDDYSEGVAEQLRASGVRAETLVGICLERSPNAVGALLGILKAGGAFVPLDPQYPKERLAFMIADSRLKVVIADAQTEKRLPQGDAVVIRLENGLGESFPTAERIQSQVRAENLAHVIYTSGSTGVPKGVMSEHRASLNRFRWMWCAYPFEPGEVCAIKTTLSFVDSIWEIFGPLLQGIPVVIIGDSAARDAEKLVTELRDHDVTRVILVPSLLRVLLETVPDLTSRLPRLKLWTVSGEVLPIELARTFAEKLPDRRLLNLYGSSEVAGDATAHECDLASKIRTISIGRPIDNTQAYILDASLEPVPVGVPGELFIGGRNLARGYLGKPGLTAAKFIPHPYATLAGARLYRTGDVARYRADGAIEYLGRSDLQVKVRGFRIELGEVEANLLAHPNIREAVVAAQGGDGDRQLVAFIVPRKPPAPSADETRYFLAHKLPDFMLPAKCVAMEALPLSANGKISRAKLLEIDVAETPPARSLIPPRTETEAKLAEIWSLVLKVPRPSIHDGFFQLGGHSLIATQLVSRIREVFSIELPLRAIFEQQTIARVAVIIESMRADSKTETGPALEPVARERFRRGNRPWPISNTAN